MLPDSERFALLHGPYIAPRVNPGDFLPCEIRGLVPVGGYSDGLIPWPRLRKSGRPCLILCGDLARAVRQESEIAVAHHWGVAITTVWNWRQALKVPRTTEGTERLYEEYSPQKLTPERAARGRESAKAPDVRRRMSEAKAGKPCHPNTRKALLEACRMPKSEEWKAKRKESMKKQPKRPGAPKGHPGWGGRPRGTTMPCGWGCGASLTAAEMRVHFTRCPRRPEAGQKKS